MSDPKGTDLCLCGHDPAMHVLLPGHPDGVQECQVGDCGCGEIRYGRSQASYVGDADNCVCGHDNYDEHDSRGCLLCICRNRGLA